MTSKILAVIDVSAILCVVSTDVVEGWSKLGAIGILGAILAVIVWRLPSTVQQLTQPLREANERCHEESREGRRSIDELKESLERHQERIAEMHREHIDSQKAFQDKQIALLEKQLQAKG